MEGHRIAQAHAIGRLRQGAHAEQRHAFRRAHFGAFGIDQMQAALADFQFDPGVLDFGILGENRRQRPDAAGPLFLIHHQVFDRLHGFHRLGMREIVELLVLLHVAHGRPLARNGFHRRFVRRIRHQPEVAAQQRVGILQRKTLQVVSRPAAEAARKVAVVELVIAHADVHVGRAEAFPAPRQQAAQSRRDAEGLLLVDHVLDEVGRFQIGQREFARAVDLIAHGLEDRVGWRRLRAQDSEGAAARIERQRQHRPARQEPPHFAPPLLFSMLVGSGSSGGRSFDLAFFSISISDTRIAGATAETGTLPDSAPQ